MNERESENADPVIEAIVGAAYEVGNVLGAGFLEKVYERALMRELVSRGLSVRAQVTYPVLYKGMSVGDYVADLLVENRVLVELKCVDHFGNEHLAECINYLRASGLSVALLLNFQRSKMEWRRVAFTPGYKMIGP